MFRSWSCLLVLTGLSLCVASTPTPAQKERKVERTAEEIQQERMRRLILAGELAAEGRKKNAPEYLITAAGMLRQLSSIKDLQNMQDLDVKPEITGDDKVKDDEVKTPTLLKESDALFKEASDMGASLNVNVDKLITRAKERETSDKEERALVGGPKRISHHISGGHTHVYHFHLYTDKYTAWQFQASAPLHVTVVRHDNDNPWWTGTTMYGSHIWHPHWHPNPAVKQAPVTVRVTNPSRLAKAAQYRMVIQ